MRLYLETNRDVVKVILCGNVFSRQYSDTPFAVIRQNCKALQDGSNDDFAVRCINTRPFIMTILYVFRCKRNVTKFHIRYLLKALLLFC